MSNLLHQILTKKFLYIKYINISKYLYLYVCIYIYIIYIYIVLTPITLKVEHRYYYEAHFTDKETEAQRG